MPARTPQQDEPLAVRRRRAFALLDITKGKGNELIARGILESVVLGPRSKLISMRSIKKLVEEGIPQDPSPKR